MFEPFLTACAHAMRNTHHATSQATPGQLVFGRDVILPLQIEAGWALIAQRKQELMNTSNERENLKRVPHTFHMGDQAQSETPGMQRKMSIPRTGPHSISSVSNNGAVAINRGAFDHGVNMRRMTPHFQRGIT